MLTINKPFSVKGTLSSITFLAIMKVLHSNNIIVDINNNIIENKDTGEKFVMEDFPFRAKTEFQKKYSNVFRRQHKVRRNVMKLMDEGKLPFKLNVKIL